MVRDNNICDKSSRDNRRKPCGLGSSNEMKLNTDKCHLFLNSQEPNALPNALKKDDLHIYK